MNTQQRFERPVCPPFFGNGRSQHPPLAPAASRGSSRSPAIPKRSPSPAVDGAVETRGALLERVRSGVCDMVQGIKALMKIDVSQMCDGTVSREQVCECLSENTGRPFTPHVLNGLIAPSRPDRKLAASDIPAWCATTGSLRVLESIAAECGQAIGDERLVEAGRLLYDIRQRERRLGEVMDELLRAVGAGALEEL